MSCGNKKGCSKPKSTKSSGGKKKKKGGCKK